ncbi:MAG: type II secretion system F family protein [Thermoguttaceae bacterium]|jgi:general secretion pathway protein F/type IV pilus assembly protein PilC
MPQFNYTARDPAGQKVTGVLEAATRREALAALAGRQLFPLEIGGSVKIETRGRGRRVPASVLAPTLGLLADLLGSGVPLLRALEVLRQQASHAGLREVLGEVHREVQDGTSLAEAMGHYPRVFGEMTISMVRAGAEGGFLEEALARVAQFTEAQEDLKNRTIGAMAYPCFLGTVGVIVVIILLIFFVPKFESLFENMRKRGQLPILTEWLLTTSALAWQWSFWIVAGGSLLGGLAWQWFNTENGRVWRDLAKLRMPILGKVFRSLAVARFCRVLGTLLQNGVPILRALDISSSATANRILGEAIRKATENISAGQSLARPLGACGHFPTTVVEMISVAEEANTLEKVLLNIAESQERRTWRQIDLAVRLLEPILLLLIAGVVLVLVIALLLPMFKMATTF